ncbi:MAG TPA: ATP-binding cassette domain-containing protein [Bacteroidia bacterium]|nr:ATP-binding cassette domain-containing protein [Bacteroidia bacterium]
MIELRNISKTFNKGKVSEVIALKDLSLKIEKEEFVVIVGSNGSGKTTLLNIIAGAEFSSTGNILINNTDVTRLPEYKRSRWIARVFQNPLSGTASELSILDNFRLAAIRTTKKNLIIGINETFKKQVRDKIATLGMGLENKLDQAMGTLSGGQRQALTLLMSVMDDTQILLLDEPTAALDPRSAAVIMQTADNLIKQYKLTAILITHNLKEAHTYGNRLIQMGEGKVLKDISSSQRASLQLPEMYEWFN